MKHNMGVVDRLLRAFVFGPVLLVLGLTVFDVGSVLGIVTFVLAGIMFVPAAVAVCPAYMPFGISTRGGISTHGHVYFGGPTRVVTQH